MTSRHDSPARRHGARFTCWLALAVALGLGFGCSRGEADAAASPVEPAATAEAPAVESAAAGDAAPQLEGAAAPTPSAAPAADAPLSPDQLPAVVAKIDGQAVTKEDLLSRAAEARGALAERGFPPPPPTRDFYRSVLDDIIGNRLLHADLKAKGIGAPAEQVEARFAQIRGQFPSPEEFSKALAARGFDEKRLRADLEEGLAVQHWVEQTVMPSIAVTEAEARKFYDDNPEQMQEPESVLASHVLVAVPQGASDADKSARRERAAELRAKIAGGADFAAVARESSEDTGSAPRGGDLGRVYRGQTVPAFEAAAFGLAPGTLSEPVESPFGFHIIRVAEKKPAGKLEFDRVKERITQVLRQRALETKVRDAVQALAAKANVEVLF